MLRVSDAFTQTLNYSRSVDWRATLYDKNENPLALDLKISDWTLSLDAQSSPHGVMTITVIDPHWGLDVSVNNSGKWLSRLLKFEWGLYVADRFEYVPLIYGPITDTSREGARVSFRVSTKDGQHVDPYFFKRSFSVRKHTKIHEAIRALMQERGETKFDLDTVHRRLDRDRTWVAGVEPWQVVRNLTDALPNHQIFYRADGFLKLRTYPEQPTWKFASHQNSVGGAGSATIVGHARDSVSIEPLRDTVIVRGEKHYKKQIEKTMRLDQKATAGDTSIHVEEDMNVSAGKRLVIGRGGVQETRTVDGSYTPGSRTIPLVRALDYNHVVGAPVVITLTQDKMRPVIGRAEVAQNHPLSAGAQTNGYRPRIKIEDRPNIHKKEVAEERARKIANRMSLSVEQEIEVKSLIIPHLELGDIALVDDDFGYRRFRINSIELNSDGTMTLNRRRKRTPKKVKRRQKGPKALVKRVRVETTGTVLSGALTMSWNDGANLAVEAVTDFNDAGGTIVFEPGTANEEIAYYTSRDEANDWLVGVTRPNTKYAHGALTFIQEGATPTIEKSIDGFVDDELVAAVGIPVPPTKYGYFSVETTEVDEKVVPLKIDEDYGELSVLEGPEGEPPLFGQDLDILPAVGGGDASQSETDAHGNVNPPPGMGYEDGAVPSGTVTPVVTGSASNTLGVRFVTLANNSQVTYKLHAHTTLGFTPGDSTLVDTRVLDGTPGLTHAFSFRDFPAGHVLDGTASDPPQPGTTYEVCIVPADGSGDAPGPYPRATGTPVKVGTVAIDTGAITEALLAANAVTETKISNQAVTTPKILAGAVTAGKIAAGSVEAEKIAASAVTTDKLDANAVTSAKIAANTIVAGDIAVGTITATEIAATTITADKLSISSLSAITANLGTITAGSITGVTITGATVTGGTVQTAASGNARVSLSSSVASTVQWIDSSNAVYGSIAGSAGTLEVFANTTVRLSANSIVLYSGLSDALTVSSSSIVLNRVPNFTGGTGTATGGILGYIQIQVSGTDRRIPYYAV